MQSLAEGKSVVVAAPTSSGKTLVGEFAIEEALHANKTLFFTTPRKALSNEKFEDFTRRYGAENVGLMTGDVTINRNAPIIVMTTEVLRNMLYNQKTDPGLLQDLKSVVFDECHFIDDPDRGVVWEETILNLPPDIQQVHLSATIHNARQYTAWLNALQPDDIRKSVPASQFALVSVSPTHRPVPLKSLYLSPSGQMSEVGEAGDRRWNNQFHQLFQREAKRTAPKDRWFDPVSAVTALSKKDQKYLPAIFFVFSRKRCEQYAERLLDSGRVRLTSPEERQAIGEVIEKYAKVYPWIQQSPLLDYLEEGIGYHHGGMLPYEKRLVELLMQKGLLKTVFATDTLAAGINVPAKSVVFTAYKKKVNGLVQWMSDSDYHQAKGRAGRRGMDKVGYVIHWHPEENQPESLWRFVGSKPGGVNSQMRVTPNLVLNLQEQYSREEVQELLEKSFKLYQSPEKAMLSEPTSTFPPGKAGRKERRLARKRVPSLIVEFQAMQNFLQKTGFMTTELKPTPLGKLAASLPNENSLTLAKMVDEGLLNDLAPTELAALLSALVTSNEREIQGFNFANPNLENRYAVLEKRHSQLSHQGQKDGIDMPAMNPLMVNQVERWCQTGNWEEILETPFPGKSLDVIRRTANLLRHLYESPEIPEELRARAQQAEELLLQSPVKDQIGPQVLDV